MAQNFFTCDREQPLLLPPDLHDWLDEDHLAWFVIEAIEELDLDAFYTSYRADGHGAAPPGSRRSSRYGRTENLNLPRRSNTPDTSRRASLRSCRDAIRLEARPL